jgi:opacity protein-like surface antigen
MKKLIVASALCISAASLAQPPAHIGPSDGTGNTQQGQQGQQSHQGHQGQQGQGAGTASGAWSGSGGPPNGTQSMRNYPPCSRTVTDSCIQTNERGMRRAQR